MAQPLTSIGKRWLALVFATAVAVYVPTARYGFVEDDRAVGAANPRAHSIPQAVRAVDPPYWGDEFYRPLTVLSFAVDWTVSGGRAGWLHLMNALWHGVASVLVALLLASALSPAAAVAGGLVFALHPLHTEAVAGLVGRAEVHGGGAARAPRAARPRRGPGDGPAGLAAESVRRLRSAGHSRIPGVLARGARRHRDGRRDARGRVVGQANGAGVDVRGVGRRGRVSPHLESVVSLRDRARGTRPLRPGAAGRGRGGVRGGLGAEPLEAAARRPGGWDGPVCVRGHDAGAAAGVA